MAEEGQGGPLPSSGPFSTQPRLAFRSASLLLSSPSLPSFGDAPLPVEQDLGSQHRMCGPGQGAPTPASPAPCSTHQPRGSKGHISYTSRVDTLPNAPPQASSFRSQLRHLPQGGPYCPLHSGPMGRDPLLSGRKWKVGLGGLLENTAIGEKYFFSTYSSPNSNVLQ